MINIQIPSFHPNGHIHDMPPGYHVHDIATRLESDYFTAQNIYAIISPTDSEDEVKAGGNNNNVFCYRRKLLAQWNNVPNTLQWTAQSHYKHLTPPIPPQSNIIVMMRTSSHLLHGSTPTLVQIYCSCLFSLLLLPLLHDSIVR